MINLDLKKITTHHLLKVVENPVNWEYLEYLNFLRFYCVIDEIEIGE